MTGYVASELNHPKEKKKRPKKKERKEKVMLSTHFQINISVVRHE